MLKGNAMPKTPPHRNELYHLRVAVPKSMFGKFMATLATSLPGVSVHSEWIDGEQNVTLRN
jgi:hypothetical protein